MSDETLSTIIFGSASYYIDILFLQFMISFWLLGIEGFAPKEVYILLSGDITQKTVGEYRVWFIFRAKKVLTLENFVDFFLF